MAEGRNIQGGVGTTGLRWWQKGSTEKKPTYFTGNAADKFFKQQQNLVNRAEKYYDKEFTLIGDRNTFFAANKNIIKEPKYTFNEAMGLAKNGYTGLYGRSADKKTIGLMGEAWQQAYALDRLRKNKQMLSFGLYGDRKATLDYMAADVVAPGTKAYNKIASLIGEFNEYGGTAKYVGRYGSTPAIDSKYGLLFNTNNKAVRKDDVLATYQNNLVKEITRSAKSLTHPDRSDEDKALGVELIGYQDYKINSTRAKPSGDKIREMEQQLIGLQETYAQPVQDAVGSPAPSINERATSAALFAIGGIPGALIGNTDTGNALANKAQTYMAGLAEHDVLKARSIYKYGSDAPLTQEGAIGLSINITKGLARFGLGLPLGLTSAAGEGITAVEEAKKVLTGEKETFGEDVDFQLGDAIWADYANRYYDPFA